MKLKRCLSTFFALLMVAATLAIPAMATEIGSGIAGEVGQGSVVYIGEDSKNKSTNPWDDIYGLNDPENQVHIKGVTTEDVTNLIDRKGNDIANIMKHIGKVASTIGFFASIICIIVGAIGNRRMMTGGFIGLIVLALAYTALNYGKELLDLFSAWVVA